MQANPSNATWLAGTCLGLVLAITMAISSTTARPAAADAKRGTGMRCESDSDCKSYDCDHGVCRGHGGDKVGTGGACESDSDCKSYDCDHGVCRGHGGEKIDAGGVCESDSDCKSYDCDHGVCRT